MLLSVVVKSLVLARVILSCSRLPCRVETMAVRIAVRLIWSLHWARHSRNKSDQLLLMRDTWVEYSRFMKTGPVCLAQFAERKRSLLVVSHTYWLL